MTKSRESVDVHYAVDDEEAIAVDRRQFVRGAALAVLTVQLLPLTASASGDPPVEGSDPADNLTIHLGPGLFSHVHDLLIPYSVLRTPPTQGVELKTTQAMLHTHTVALTQEQLKAVNRGETVTGKASSHVFVIALGNRQDRRG